MRGTGAVNGTCCYQGLHLSVTSTDAIVCVIVNKLAPHVRLICIRDQFGKVIPFVLGTETFPLQLFL